jgi:hypothetical protein
MLKTALLSATLAMAYGHANMAKTFVKRTGQTACAVHTDDPQCSSSTTYRELISREAGSIPGKETSYFCDWCGLENVPTVDQISGGQWWTSRPAAHWDESHVVPVKPCMSYDSFGDRGLVAVKAGDVLETSIYMDADHSGLYRFEIACGENATESDYMATPITAWKALHKSKDGVSLPESRDVGYTREETDAYFRATTCCGAGCSFRINPSSDGPDSSYCSGDRTNCYIEDSITIPADFQCEGSATLRWKWNSAETPQVYANCLDLKVEGGSGGAPNATCFTSESTDCEGEGDNISHATAASAGECCDRCTASSACNAYVYTSSADPWMPNTCYLKSGCSSPTPCSHCTAGMLP